LGPFLGWALVAPLFFNYSDFFCPTGGHGGPTPTVAPIFRLSDQYYQLSIVVFR
jgi:hypothetical protein